ncbi:MAG TPA: tRNA-uridine aminocarboxypropyltransferase [Polyangiaceae bacterium]|nr:tRNA-uridine aminocarboxypropyltransferase [Polyangiaceae bacterium]
MHDQVEEKQPRPHCYRCDKPELACLCDRIPLVENRTPIVIVQHKRESRHSIGTARIADLGLARRRIEVVAADQKTGEDAPGWLPPGAGLLYPGADSIELESAAPEQRPGCLVVIDGTWHQAKALFRDHLWLQRLPRYRLSPQAPSRYRLRKEPAAHCISTIEAIVQALGILEPATRAGGLLDAFEALIDDQIEHAATRAKVPRQRKQRAAPWRKLPRGLLEDHARLVVVYGEATHPGGDLSRPPELVQWSALRVRDQRAFDCVLRPAGGLPSPGHLGHLCLGYDDVADGKSLAEFRDAWAGFVEKDDLLAAWNPRTLRLLERSTGATVSGFGLKGAYHRVRHARGDLDEILAAESAQGLPAGLARALAAVRGRAGQRLRNALAAGELLRRLALEALT